MWIDGECSVECRPEPRGHSAHWDLSPFPWPVSCFFWLNWETLAKWFAGCWVKVVAVWRKCFFCMYVWQCDRVGWPKNRDGTCSESSSWEGNFRVICADCQKEEIDLQLEGVVGSCQKHQGFNQQHKKFRRFRWSTIHSFVHVTKAAWPFCLPVCLEILLWQTASTTKRDGRDNSVRLAWLGKTCWTAFNWWKVFAGNSTMSSCTFLLDLQLEGFLFGVSFWQIKRAQNCVIFLDWFRLQFWQAWQLSSLGSGPSDCETRRSSVSALLLVEHAQMKQ